MKLVFDPEGVLYWAVAVADPAGRGARAVVLAHTSDHGETWETATVAPAKTPPTPLSPAMAAVHAFAERFGGSP